MTAALALLIVAAAWIGIRWNEESERLNLAAEILPPPLPDGEVAR